MTIDLDHPCKQTCSGWKQGYERGAEDAHNLKWGCHDEITRLREALELIAAPKRADGTYNRCREACEELAKTALSRQPYQSNSHGDGDTLKNQRKTDVNKDYPND